MQSLHHQLNNYFSKQLNSHQNINYANKCTQQALFTIFNQLEQGNLSLNQYQQIIYNKNKKQQNTDKIIQNLKKSRQHMITKLHQLYDQENKVRQQLNQNTKKQKKSCEKSIITNQEKEKIKVFVKARKQFQNKVRQQLQNVMQKARRQQKLKNQQQITKKLQRINQIKQSMKKHHQLFQNQLGKVKKYAKKSKTYSKIYLYKKIQQKDNQILQQRKKYQTVILNQKRQRLKTNFQQIRKHSAQYYQSIRKKRLQSEQSSIQMSRKKSQRLYQQSQFMKIIKKQDEQLKIKQEKKLRYKKQFIQRIKDYKYYVRENFQPKVSQESKFIPKNKNNSHSQMAALQRNQLGNKYLQQSKQMSKQKSKSNNSISNPVKVKFIYKNYLADIKQIRRNIYNPQQQFDKLLENKNKLSQQKLQKAMLLSRKIEDQYEIKPSQQKQLVIANNKLKLLQNLMKVQ